jgi:nucleotide-binding universal stress UspA family protein
MLKVIVPTDFSPNAARAIDYAVQLAKTGKASLTIINSCDHLNSMGMEAGLPLSEYNERITDDAFANLEMIKNSIESAEGIKVSTELFSGTVVDTVVSAARDSQADLIIMGTMGINSIKDTLFGTNTSAVIASSKVPVLAIPLEYEWQVPRKFLLAINKFEEAGELLKPLFDLARIYAVEVHLVVRAVREAEENLKKLFPDIVLKAEHLSGRHFEETINEYAAASKTDLLGMTTHKRTIIGNIFNRSITRKMSYHSKVPLLAIPVK